MSPADASTPPPTPTAQPRLIVHRTSSRDEQSRQILVSVDGQYVGQLLYGGTLVTSISPGPHRLGLNNTLFWKTVPFTAEPGTDAHFTVWNQPFGGNVMRMMFIFFGAAPLSLGFAEGPPDQGGSTEGRDTAGTGTP
jgi:hypothetical protein